MGPEPAGRRVHGLYVLTPENLTGAALLSATAAALAGGARLVQYRAKRQANLADALALSRLCATRDVPLLVNDDPDLAAAAGAAGVHLGRHDPDCAAARARLPPGALVGVSCYDRLDLALRAAAAGADYVAFGSFFASRTKPAAIRASPGLLHAARSALALPIVAIGGITPDNGGVLLAAGADALAVSAGVFEAADPCAAAARYAALFDSTTPTQDRPA